LTSPEDLAAVQAVLDGDIDAFESIVERWKRPLVNLAYRYCLDHSRAEDLAQEAFLRAFRHLRSWRREAAFSTWLFALASNLYRTELKRLPPRAESLDRVVVAGGPGPEALLGRREIAWAVRAAVAALPGKYRDPITHYYLHEQDVALSAAMLGMPEGTFKARLARGRALLRDRLGRWAGGRR
jgi:RNA polymerase sigma-70 factor (ECF subfamily)